MIIVIIGLPATGKSTIARKLKKYLGGNICYLSTDQIRKSLFEHLISNTKDIDIYHEDFKQIVYNNINYIVDLIHLKFETIIIDGTFHKLERLNKLLDFLNNINENYRVYETIAPDEVIRKRIAKRDTSSESDARLDEYFQLKSDYSIPDNVIKLDTTLTINENINQILRDIET